MYFGIPIICILTYQLKQIKMTTYNYAVIIKSINKTKTFKFVNRLNARIYAEAQQLKGKLIDFMIFDNGKWESLYF